MRLVACIALCATLFSGVSPTLAALLYSGNAEVLGQMLGRSPQRGSSRTSRAQPSATRSTGFRRDTNKQQIHWEGVVMKTLLIACAAATFVAVPAFAQQRDPDTTTTLDPVVVTDRKPSDFGAKSGIPLEEVPQSIQVLESILRPCRTSSASKC